MRQIKDFKIKTVLLVSKNNRIRIAKRRSVIMILLRFYCLNGIERQTAQKQIVDQTKDRAV